MRDIVLIVGMHRSGSSLLSRIVNLMGADLGRDLLPPKPDNPRGFWENAAIVRAHDDFLWSINRLWDNPVSLPEEVFLGSHAAALSDRLADILDDECSGNLIAVKDPRSCRLLPCWKSMAERKGYRLKVLFLHRDVQEVAGSLERRGDLTLDQAGVLWARYLVDAERDSRDLDRHFISYSALLEDWQGEIARAGEALRIAWPNDMSKTRHAINDFLEPGLRHHVAASLQRPESPLWQDILLPLNSGFMEAAGGTEINITAVSALADGLAAQEMLFARALERWDREVIDLRRRVEDRDVLASRLLQVQDAVTEMKHERSVILNQLDAMYASTSWRVTAPLRWMTLQVRKLRSAVSRSGLRRIFRNLYYALPLPWSIKRRLRAWIAPLLRGADEGEGGFVGKGPCSRIVDASSIIAPDSDEVARILEGGEKPAFEQVDSPQASVIVPVYNKVEHTVACLLSIAANHPGVNFEIIVIDDGSSDRSAEILDDWPGVRYHRNPENLGFIGACNAGAELARGRYACFLNNDTNVLHGWLDELVDTIESSNDIGLVGSKLIYPDMRLQEAGGIVWRDGSAWNYGRLEDPDAPVHSYRRDVDYVSGASILVPLDLFRRFGGFDTLYSPAYYEDTDIAFKVRDAGLRTVMQPESIVIHYEGVSSGTDLSSGMKQYQEVNAGKFLDRWRDTLSAHRPNAEHPEAEKERAVEKRLLMIDATLPFPDQDAGSVIADHFIRIFQRLGYKVTFMPENLEYNGKYVSRLQRAGVECIYYPFVPSLGDFLKRRGAEFDAFFVARPYVADLVLDRIRYVNPEAPLIYNTCDLHYLREQRQAAVEGNPLLAEQALATKRQELNIIGRADCAIVVSPVEKELLAKELPEARVEVIQLIQDEREPGPGPEDREGMLFIGGFQHHPNGDAVKHFVNDVMPGIREEVQNARLVVVGSKPGSDIRNLASEDVEIRGFVEDLDPVMDALRFMVVPLRYGAGVKGKIGTAFAYGLPVISSTVGVEGMGLTEGEDYLRADTPEEWVEQVRRLEGDDELWRRLSEAGRRIVRERYSPVSVAERLQRIITEIG